MHLKRKDTIIIWKFALIVVAIISALLIGNAWYKINSLQNSMEEQNTLEQQHIGDNSE